MSDLFNIDDDNEENEQIISSDKEEILSVDDGNEETPSQLPESPVILEEKKKSPLSDLFDVFETFCYALVLMMILFVFIFRFVTVEGTSMTNTLANQDKLIISDLFYEPETGDIVVINTEGISDFAAHKYIIKRVIATGGQTVNIDLETWRVTVDGTDLTESYVRRDNMFASMNGFDLSDWPELKAEEDGSYTFTVPEGQVFVMGDNRNGSSDSRAAGCLEEERILGRVLLRVSPSFGRVK